MAGEAIRSLHAAIGWQIDMLPLQKLDKLMDDIKSNMIGGAVDRFGDEMKHTGKETTKTTTAVKQLGTAVDRFDDEVKHADNDTKKTTTAVKQLGSAARSTGKQVDGMSGRFRSFKNSANDAFRSVKSGFGAIGRIARAPFSLPGLITGGVAAYGAGKLVSTSIGGAADLEMQGMQLEALMGNAKKAQQLFQSMNQKGIKSVFSEQDFLEGAKTFLPMTKDLKKIDFLTNLQERLAASNPLEGMSGAAFSMREAMTGDIQSLSDRFNIGKKDLRAAGFDPKAKDIMTNVKALDKVLTKYGFTQSYLTKVNESANAQWGNMKSNFEMNLKRSGKKALEELKPFMKDMNKFLSSDRAQRMFDRWGQALGKLSREAANFGRWLMDEGGKAFDYLDRKYFSNEKFQKLPFNKKIDVVFADIKQRFDKWYDTDGKKSIEAGAQKFIDFTIGVLKNNLPALANSGLDIGKALGSGLWDGVQKEIANHPILTMVLGAAAGSRLGLYGAAAGIGAAATVVVAAKTEQAEKNKQNNIDILDRLRVVAPELSRKSGYTVDQLWLAAATNPQQIQDLMQQNGISLEAPGKASGMPYVPRNDMMFRLHEGERVLTSQENRDYTKERHSSSPVSRGMPPVTINQHFASGTGSDVKRQAYNGAHAAFEEYFDMLQRINPPVTEG